MKYTVTGSLGNISKPLVEILIKNGHDVTVISSNPEKKNAIGSMGAKAAIGSINDTAFLINAFKGADAVYTMVPPDFSTSNYRQHMADTGKNYHEAIKASGVKRVVNLSSIGAHLSEGTGPVAGLHGVEQTLNTLDGVAIKHLRPGYFFTNFFFDVATIRNFGIMGNNYGAESKLSMVHPGDVAVVAAEELQNEFEGKSHRYVVGDEQLLGGMTGAGMSDSIASLYVEMGHAIDKGILFEDFHKQPEFVGKTKITDFAKEFAAVYNSNQ